MIEGACALVCPAGGRGALLISAILHDLLSFSILIYLYDHQCFLQPSLEPVHGAEFDGSCAADGDVHTGGKRK